MGRYHFLMSDLEQTRFEENLRNDQNHRNRRDDQNHCNEQICHEEDTETLDEHDVLKAMMHLRLNGGFQLRNTLGYAPPEQSLERPDEKQRILHDMLQLDSQPCNAAHLDDVSVRGVVVASRMAPTKACTSKRRRKDKCPFGINCKLIPACSFNHAISNSY